MADSSRDNSVNFTQVLKEDSKKRYDNKLKLLNCEEDPYKQLESPGTFSSMVIQWHEWPDLMYPDIYNYLILTPSLYNHEQLKSYNSLDGYNQYCEWMGK